LEAERGLLAGRLAQGRAGDRGAENGGARQRKRRGEMNGAYPCSDPF